MRQTAAATRRHRAGLNPETTPPLHCHHDQDGWGESEHLVYGIVPLFDMNRVTGATAVVPRSHRHAPRLIARLQMIQEAAAASEPHGTAPAPAVTSSRSLREYKKRPVNKKYTLEKRFRNLCRSNFPSSHVGAIFLASTLVFVLFWHLTGGVR